jgi:hypothetical protein
MRDWKKNILLHEMNHMRTYFIADFCEHGDEHSCAIRIKDYVWDLSLSLWSLLRLLSCGVWRRVFWHITAFLRNRSAEIHDITLWKKYLTNKVTELCKGELCTICHWIRNCLGEAGNKFRIVVGKPCMKGTTFEALRVMLRVIEHINAWRCVVDEMG